MRTLSRVFLVGLGLLAVSAPPAGAQSYPVTITNNCSYQIYVVGSPASSAMPYTPLPTGQSTVYTLTPPAPGGRVYGCWNDVSGHLGDTTTLIHNCAWIELTVGANGNLFSNISYVDFISIPIEIQAGGGTACVPSNATVATFFDETAVQQQCPTQLAPSLTTPANDKACMSAFHLCSDTDGRPSDPSCTLLDPIIATCVSTPATYPGCATGSGTNTVDVYGCRPPTFWSTTAGQAYCMAMNRGILASYADQSDPSTFYPKNGTFNAYGAFVHGLPGAGPVFALPYDDYPPTLNQGGYVNCATSTQYSITFCNTSAAATRVSMKGAFTRVVHNPGKNRIEVTGSFAPRAPIDLTREKILLESVLDETGGSGELVSGRGAGRTPLPLALFRLPDEDARAAATFETPDGVTPSARLRLVQNLNGRYDFSLSVRAIAIKQADGCAKGKRVQLTTRFTLEAAALEVARQQSWGCSDGRTFQPNG